MKEAAAPAKINLALVVGPVRAGGMHEVATVLQRIVGRSEPLVGLSGSSTGVGSCFVNVPGVDHVSPTIVLVEFSASARTRQYSTVSDG